jgi:hypothetical protein
LGGNAQKTAPQHDTFCVLLGFFMVKQNFAGELLLEWFAQNRKDLASRGFVIESFFENPEAYWIEPAAMMNFKTPFYLGGIEVTIDGRCSVIAYHSTEDDNTWYQHFLFLEPAAIEYRKKDWYGGNPEEVNWKPQFTIQNADDYTIILEPVINHLMQANPNQP